MSEKWLEDFENTLLPIQHVLRNRFEAAGGWRKVAEAACYSQTHGQFRRDMPMSLMALALMFLNHPVELDDQLELLD
jgi:hypothetical protein